MNRHKQKNIFSLLVATSLFYCFTISVYSLTWPVSATGITGTHGEYRGSVRLHKGIDINAYKEPVKVSIFRSCFKK